MQKTQVTLIVHFKAKPGMAKDLEQAAIKLIPLTKSEAGCIEYSFHASTQDPNTFLFYENWVDQEALDKHANMPYLLEFKTLLDKILDEPAQFTYWRMHN